MALSFSSVEKAYKVLNQIKKEHLPQLDIPSFPEDVYDRKPEDREDLNPDVVYGWDQKYDNGWESLFFYTASPSDELKQDFAEWAKAVPNTHISRLDTDSGYWKFGWF